MYNITPSYGNTKVNRPVVLLYLTCVYGVHCNDYSSIYSDFLLLTDVNTDFTPIYRIIVCILNRASGPKTPLDDQTTSTAMDIDMQR
jgi:hypothetical protein